MLAGPPADRSPTPAGAVGYDLAMKRILLVLAAALLLLLCVLGGRVLLLSSRQPEATPVQVQVDDAAVADRLAQALRFRTISAQDRAAIDPEPFLALHAWLAQTYPAAHGAMQREAVGELSALYTWPGADPSLAPVLLLAHVDVVPVEPGTESGWTHPPFAGVVADGFVWGRGAIDMKAALVGIFEAAETLAARGWQPQRTILIALGHDEEVGGQAGQARVRALLESRGQRLHWVLDEGLVIVDGIIPALQVPAGLVGVAEKGYLSLQLSVEGVGGHSSMPPPQTAAGIVAAAVTKLEADPFPGGLDGPVGTMFDWLAPEMQGPLKLAFANRWLLGAVIESQLEAKPNTNATLRTTMAVTQLSGSVQDNVLPQRATAVVNLRLHPRDSVDSATARVAAIIDDPRVTLTPLTGTLYSEPQPMSPVDGPGFTAIATALREVHPDVVVAPGLMIGGTDSRYFVDLADGVYRFHPFWAKPGDTDRIHGTDERIAVDNIADYVRFYERLLVGL